MAAHACILDRKLTTKLTDNL